MIGAHTSLMPCVIPVQAGIRRLVTRAFHVASSAIQRCALRHAAVTFFVLPKIVTKERRAHENAPSGFLPLLGRVDGCRKLASLGQAPPDCPDPPCAAQRLRGHSTSTAKHPDATIVHKQIGGGGGVSRSEASRRSSSERLQARDSSGSNSCGTHLLEATVASRGMCHSRAGGNPEPSAARIDSRLRGNDTRQAAMRKEMSWQA